MIDRLEELKKLSDLLPNNADSDVCSWAADEIENLRNWVSDCQSGMYVNCVYCGHRYGPKDGTPVAMADILTRHIEQCSKHPMSALKAEVEDLRRKTS